MGLNHPVQYRPPLLHRPFTSILIPDTYNVHYNKHVTVELNWVAILFLYIFLNSFPFYFLIFNCWNIKIVFFSSLLQLHLLYLVSLKWRQKSWNKKKIKEKNKNFVYLLDKRKEKQKQNLIAFQLQSFSYLLNVFFYDKKRSFFYSCCCCCCCFVGGLLIWIRRKTILDSHL